MPYTSAVLYWAVGMAVLYWGLFGVPMRHRLRVLGAIVATYLVAARIQVLSLAPVV